MVLNTAVGMLTFSCIRFQETQDRLAAKLESIYTASGGKRITVISHSMGGLLVKCFMSLQPDVSVQTFRRTYTTP